MEESPRHTLRGDLALCAFLALSLLTFVATYALSLTVDHHRLRSPYLFLSESIDYAPSSCVGSFLLSPACALYATTVYLRHEQLGAMGLAPRGRWLGLVAALGGHGVASFQVHNAFLTHYGCAALFFVGSTAYVMLCAAHERRRAVPTRSRACSVVRQVAAVLAPLLVLYVLVVGPLLLGRAMRGADVDYKDDEPRRADDDPLVYDYVLELAIAELAIYFTFAAYFASLLPELAVVRIGFSLLRHAPPDAGSAAIAGGALSEPFINYIAPHA